MSQSVEPCELKNVAVDASDNNGTPPEDIDQSEHVNMLPDTPGTPGTPGSTDVLTRDNNNLLKRAAQSDGSPRAAQSDGSPPVKRYKSDVAGRANIVGAKESGGKNGPKSPLPVLDVDAIIPCDTKLKLVIPRVTHGRPLDVQSPFPLDDGETARTFYRLHSTPTMPLFIDNDPNLAFGSAVDSPLPFATSRQNSTNSLVRFSERLFEDEGVVNSDEAVNMSFTRELDSMKERFSPLHHSDSDSSDSTASGLIIRSIPNSPHNGSPRSLNSGNLLKNNVNIPVPQIAVFDSATAISLQELPSEQELSSDALTSADSVEATQSTSASDSISAVPVSAPSCSSSSTYNSESVSTSTSTSASPTASTYFPASTSPSASTSSCLNLSRTNSSLVIETLLQEVFLISQRLSSENIKVDENLIFLALERYKNAPDRLKIVFREFSDTNKTITSMRSDEATLSAEYQQIPVAVVDHVPPLEVTTESALIEEDTMHHDVMCLKKIFPDRDALEIYAYVKAKQFEENRLDLVAEKLLMTRTDSSKSQQSEPSDDAPTTTHTGIEEDVDYLSNIFPDCDRSYLYEQLALRQGDPNGKEALAARMAELRNYPKRSDKNHIKVKVTKSKFSLREFVKTFPNAEKFFGDCERAVNESYKTHVRTYLLNYFTSIDYEFINESMVLHNWHLTPTYKYIQQTVADFTRSQHLFANDQHEMFTGEPRTLVLPYPDIPDEMFFKEVQFIENETEISHYLDLAAKERRRLVSAARDSGDLMECSCCYDNEVLFQEMQACEDGHLFCVQCIRMSTETAIGEGKSSFHCLTADCDASFSFNVLSQILKPEVMNKVLQRVQDEEVRMADIPNLVSCPFCHFATIMEDDLDKLLRCQNPQCLQESCRLCREPNHLPMSCEELKKDCTDMRTFIEQRVSEAMIRICHRCKKRYYKHDGCNKITCACGATMCYVCRLPDICYEHFGETEDKCSLYEDVTALHKQEMEDAGRRAYDEYISLHPDTNHQYDPDTLTKDLPDGHGHHDDYHSDDSDVDMESDDNDWSDDDY